MGAPTPATAFLCAGAAHWDLIARTDAPLPPGADVPGRITRRPGGVALNVALALAALGRPVTLLAALGTDVEGDALFDRIAAAGVAPALARHAGPTDAYLAIESADGSLLAGIADCTGLERNGPALLAALRHGNLPAPWPGQMVLDGNLSLPVLTALLDAATGPVALVPASPRKAAALAPLLGRRPLSLYVNLGEAAAIAGCHFTDAGAAAVALVAAGATRAVVTDGARPAAAATAASLVCGAPPAVSARSVTGAGDTFVAAHLSACVDGLDAEPALAAALAAAAHHITREVA